MTDYEIFNWLYAYVIFIERLKSGKYVLTHKNLSGDEVSIECIQYEISKVLLHYDLWVREVLSEFISFYVAIPVGGDVVYNKSGHIIPLGLRDIFYRCI